MSESVHLKRYVESHPDNKMAWYLLGKDYERHGEHGKANFCFNRAEEVYEAFEHSKVPADIWKNYQQKLLQEEQQREKRVGSIRRAALALALFLLFLVPSAAAPEWSMDSWAKEELDSGEKLSALAEAESRAGEEKPEAEGPLFTAAGSDAEGQGGLSSLFQKPSELPESSVVLGMKQAGTWKLWSDQMPLLYGVKVMEGGGITVTPLQGDGANCDCGPLEGGTLKELAVKWSENQLNQAVLASALDSFYTAKGRLPKELKELSGPFPENWLAGSSDKLEELYKVYTDVNGSVTKARAERQGASTELAMLEKMPGLLGSSPDGAPFFREMLRVVIDRKQHRLAVVSGDVILRSYKVGLGESNKTPLGTFRIADKVINPNGTGNGVYGTRGMQLSDTNYAIHGTADVDSIGANVSEGCIRMLTEDVEELFDLVPMGTEVKIGEGLLPDLDLTSEERFALKRSSGQGNPSKTYVWLD
ncbi:L,D-transpeptidase [Paenibacillus sp. F411]|uniref:L,D-transpeptidase n=1 Tax=Paenibacillus sp. F411 TaxID=2820239 RepID=UPI001AAE7CE4|nr:L,D-transpeptidase [Paenibacillus sp. F411]MBO2942591.1 L,D-transpeptidase [Paenibacillus sp. F411]